MPKAIDLMRKREEEIAKALLHLRKDTKDFTEPKLILIGGYALRAFVSISRYTRDCDFAMPKRNGWGLDTLISRLPEGFQIETLEKVNGHGYLRCLKVLGQARSMIKIALDFMEGAVVGRQPRDIVRIDQSFVEQAHLQTIAISDQRIEFYLPHYRDYLLLKLVSCRPSDIRDIASLIKERGVPDGLSRRARELLPHPEVLEEKLSRIIEEMSRKEFLDSWRGAFATKQFTEEDKQAVIRKLEGLTKT